MKARGWVVLFVFYGLLPLYQVVDYVSAQLFADAADNLNFAASIIAYDWLLLNVLIGLKIPILQKGFPYDARIRVHVWTTVGITAFLAWHSVYYLAVKVKHIDVVSWTLMALFAGLVLLSVLWIPFPGLKAARLRVQGWFKNSVLQSYDLLKDAHKLLFFALAALTYVHILDAKLIGVASELSSAAFQALFVVAAAAFAWTRLQNLTLPRVPLVSVTTEGGIVRLVLARHPRLRYRAGQFAFLRFEHPQLKGEEHPFSFTSAPQEPDVRFAVRALGDFTSKLALLKPGDLVRVNAGFGDFYPADDGHPLALIGSGIGAAPLVSLLKDLAHREPNREVVCLLAVTTRAELVEADALAKLAVLMPRLTLKVSVFDEGGELYGPDVLGRSLGDALRYRYYLCSSDKVRTVVVQALRTLGVRAGKIHFEAFNLG